MKQGPSVPAFSLNSAIVLILMMSIIISALLLGLRLNLHVHNQSLVQSALVSDIESAFVYAVNQEVSEADDSVLISPFAPLHYKKFSWGLFDVVHVKGNYKNLRQERAALLSKCIAIREYPLLHLTGGHTSLSVCGTTRLEGAVYCPDAHIKRAYIEGQNYRGDKLHYGSLNDAKKWKPPLQPDQLSVRVNAAKARGIGAEQLMPGQIGERLEVSFQEPTLCLSSSGPMQIQKQFSGNIIFISDSLITVRASAGIENCLLLAPYILIEEGFEGSLQAFASKEIMVEDQVRLDFPSVLVHYGVDNKQVSGIVIEEGCSVEGLILAHADGMRFSKNLIRIEKDSFIKGLIYTNGSASLKANVQGSLWCQKLMLKTPGSVYENALLNVHMSQEKLPDWFPCSVAEADKLNVNALVNVR